MASSKIRIELKSCEYFDKESLVRKKLSKSMIIFFNSLMYSNSHRQIAMLCCSSTSSQQSNKRTKPIGQKSTWKIAEPIRTFVLFYLEISYVLYNFSLLKASNGRKKYEAKKQILFYEQLFSWQFLASFTTSWYDDINQQSNVSWFHFKPFLAIYVGNDF